ncbi:hypothetical protein [Streptomyces sp. NBC_01276]|uniref:hypothetical protein n=1 Tax=Streptomyces sp. NBC_01276 TaxID=2903808 RepID=UPI00352F5BAD
MTGHRNVTRCPVADVSGTGVRMALAGGLVVHDPDSEAGRAASARAAPAVAAASRPDPYATVHGGDRGRHRFLRAPRRTEPPARDR